MFQNEQVLGVVSTTGEETYSSRMFRHLRFLLQELKVQLSQFDLYAVAAGPGSFTGLRVGLTAVKGWAEAHQKPIAAVSALEAVAAQAHGVHTLVAPVIDARRGQIYGALYARPEKRLERLGDEVVMTPEQFVKHLEAQAGNRELALVTPNPDIQAALCGLGSPLHSCAVEIVSSVLALPIGELAYFQARRSELVDALHLDANYIRRSDAELLWKGS